MQLKSIIQKNMDHCYICYTTQGLEYHHIMFGVANRKKADKYGVTCMLCHACHRTSKLAVHQNRQTDLALKKDAQKKFEEIYGHKKWMEIFNKNYL